ncbi:MAG: hypothetical protein BGN91_14900 [Nitrobacter sp. 62-13]|jgi:hypothetical protein|nr:MAG: hypothetical protein BGN91_14900 [Nitrobacter sp. 62-13]
MVVSSRTPDPAQDGYQMSDDEKTADTEDKTIVEQGPSIGEYRRESIPEYIVDSNGDRFEFDRIALEGGDGGLEPSQLEKNECLISPGLIYRKSGGGQASN